MIRCCCRFKDGEFKPEDRLDSVEQGLFLVLTIGTAFANTINMFTSDPAHRVAGPGSGLAGNFSSSSSASNSSSHALSWDVTPWPDSPAYGMLALENILTFLVLAQLTSFRRFTVRRSVLRPFCRCRRRVGCCYLMPSVLDFNFADFCGYMFAINLFWFITDLVVSLYLCVLASLVLNSLALSLFIRSTSICTLRPRSW